PYGEYAISGRERGDDPPRATMAARHEIELRLHRTHSRLVREERPGPSVAGAGRDPLGHSGQRDHASADPRVARPARLAGLDEPLAHAGGAGGRTVRRGGARMGPPRLS